MKNKQLKGFTILEALISILLMSVIITLTYTLFSMVSKQLVRFEDENTQIRDYNLFNITLMNDIQRAHDFDVVGERLVLKNYDDSKIYYEVDRSNISRTQEAHVDTFKAKVIEYKFSNNDKEKRRVILKIGLLVLNDTIHANYFLKHDRSKIINSKYF